MDAAPAAPHELCSGEEHFGLWWWRVGELGNPSKWSCSDLISSTYEEERERLQPSLPRLTAGGVAPGMRDGKNNWLGEDETSFGGSRVIHPSKEGVKLGQLNGLALKAVRYQ